MQYTTTADLAGLLGTDNKKQQHRDPVQYITNVDLANLLDTKGKRAQARINNTSIATKQRSSCYVFPIPPSVLPAPPYPHSPKIPNTYGTKSHRFPF